MIGAIKYALKEEHFALVAGAAVSLMLLGTVVYSLGEGWSVGDGRYFAFCTVTTQSIADPNLTLTHEWLKDFTIIYTLAGLGILVEFGRELGIGILEAHNARKAREAKRHKEDPPETQSAG